MNAIFKFVMSFLAKKSGKTGITTIQRAKGLNVELSVKQIAQTLENMGVDVSKITSPKEVEKHLNIHQSWLKKQGQGSTISKKSADVLDLSGKKIPPGSRIMGGEEVIADAGSIEGIKKRMDKIKGMSDELYGGKKPPKGNINYEQMEEKLGIKLLRNENFDELVQIEKRIKEGTFPRHQRKYDEAVKLEDSKIAKDKYHIPDIIDPEDFAYGGVAGMLGERADGGRIGYDEGGIGAWIKKKLKENKEAGDEAKKEFLERENLDMTVAEWDALPLKEQLKKYYVDANVEFAKEAWDNIKHIFAFAQGGRTGYAEGTKHSASDLIQNFDWSSPYLKSNDFTLSSPYGESTAEFEATQLPPEKKEKSNVQFYPQASVRIGEADIPGLRKVAPEITPESKDIVYGGTIMGEKDGLYGGVEGLKIKNKIDFVLDNQTLFKDTTDDEIINFILGKKGKYGDIRLKADKDLENAQISWNWKFAGGGLAPMLGEPAYADGGRVPLGGGKFVFDAARRKFLQMVGAGAAGVGVAKSGLLGLLKAGKPTAQVLTSVPIKDISGMPAWFKPLVNRVIKEGDDVTKKFATKEREIVHTKQLDNGDDVYLHQDLDTGSVRIEYQGKGTFGESPTMLEYKPGEIVEDASRKAGKKIKTKDKFTAVEDDFYPQRTSPDGDFDLEFTENIVNKVDDLYSDTSKLKEFATGKKLTIKEISESIKKKNYIKEVNKNPNDHAFRNMPDEPYASGGRVPYWKGSTAPPNYEWGEEEIPEWIKSKLGKMTHQDQPVDRDTSILDRMKERQREGQESKKLYEGEEGTYKDFWDVFYSTSQPHIDYAPFVEFDDGTIYYKQTGEYYKQDGTQVEGPSKGAKPVPETVEVAEGGRVPMFKGGPIWKKFIEGFFLKTSNQIRRGEGLWKDLTPKQMWKQHDNLTKKLKEWKMSNYEKIPLGMKEYFGMNEIQLVNAFKKAQTQVKGAQPHGLSQKEMLRKKYEGKIDDNLLNQILVDDNPARIAEVTATIDEALIMQHKGMGPETIMQTFKDAWKRKKQASGGLAGMLGE